MHNVYDINNVFHINFESNQLLMQRLCKMLINSVVMVYLMTSLIGLFPHQIGTPTQKWKAIFNDCDAQNVLRERGQK